MAIPHDGRDVSYQPVRVVAASNKCRAGGWRRHRLDHMANEVIPFRGAAHSPEHVEFFSVKEVAQASGLPQPVVAQLVPRTWTDEGWMFTAEQLQRAIEIGAQRAALKESSTPGDAE